MVIRILSPGTVWEIKVRGLVITPAKNNIYLWPNSSCIDFIMRKYDTLIFEDDKLTITRRGNVND